MCQLQNKPSFGNCFCGKGFRKPSYRSRHALSQKQQRRGLTLAELLIASTIMALMATGMASLAFTVEMGNRHAKNLGIATQHARVAIGRIERALYSAHTSEQFPGFAVFSETEGSFSFPDTLVIWHPSGAPQDPDGLPRFNELVIFCPDPNAPRMSSARLRHTRNSHAAKWPSTFERSARHKCKKVSCTTSRARSAFCRKRVAYRSSGAS